VQSFSERYGYKPIKTIMQVEAMDEELRNRKEIVVKRIPSIVGICLVLMVALLGCVGKEATPKTNTEMGISALVALADSHIENCVNSMEILAMTQEVQSGEWEEMVSLLTKVDQTQVPGTRWFVLPDGSYSTVELGRTDKNLSERAYFPKLMAGNIVLGDLVVSKSTGKKSLITAVPVVREGKVIGGLGTSIFLSDLSNILSEELKLSNDMVFYAVAVENEVALHSNVEAILQDNPDLPKNAVFETSPLTGWHFAMGFKD